MKANSAILTIFSMDMGTYSKSDAELFQYTLHFLIHVIFNVNPQLILRYNQITCIPILNVMYDSLRAFK